MMNSEKLFIPNGYLRVIKGSREDVIKWLKLNYEVVCIEFERGEGEGRWSRQEALQRFMMLNPDKLEFVEVEPGPYLGTRRY